MISIFLSGNFNSKSCKKIRAIFALIFLINTIPILPAQIILSGTVTEASRGETLPGAHLRINATGTGTTTNGYGYFSLQTPPGSGDSLVISYVGYRSKKIGLTTIEESTHLDIQLEPMTTNLSEIVVSEDDDSQLLRPQHQDQLETGRQTETAPLLPIRL